MDLLYLQGYCSHVAMNWESPYLELAAIRELRQVVEPLGGLTIVYATWNSPLVIYLSLSDGTPLASLPWRTD